MAEVDYEEYGASPRFNGQQAQRLINVAGAVCSIGILVSVAVWGYRLAVRDVNGVPVIRAAQGPMRVPPATPGGEIADYQGMAVNIIAEKGAVNVMPDEIVLAPMPVELSLEDSAGLSPALPAQGAGTLSPGVQGPVPELVQGPVVVDSVTGQDPTQPVVSTDSLPPVGIESDAIARALADALATDIAPLDDAMPEPEPVQVEAGDMTTSPRPMARPSSFGITGLRSVSADVAPIIEIDPATLTVGTRLVQLGAFDTGEQARSEWSKLTGKFGDLMSGKSAVVQSALSGGRTFYRLRAHGFGGEDDARRFCTALLAEGAACIPVAHR